MILVTGGTGLLGSHLLYQLATEHEKVRAIFRSEEKKSSVIELFRMYDPVSADDLFRKIEWIKADVLDVPSLKIAFEGVDIVYHLAAIVSFRRKDFDRMMKVNREGTANMVNFALNYKINKFAYISSTAAVSINYENRKAPLIEANKWVQTSTTSGYAISKYSAEKEVWRGIEEGLNAVIINPSVIMGAGNWNESSLRIVRLVAKQFPFYSPGVNAIVDVRDVVYCLTQSVAQNLPSDRYLCAGNSITFRELMNQTADEMQVRRPRWKAGKILSYMALIFDFFKGLFTDKRTLTIDSVKTAFSETYYDSSKIKSVLKFDFRPIEDTIRFTVKNRIGNESK